MAQFVHADLQSLTLGRLIAALRERTGMSQMDLALRVGVSQPTLSRIERGHATPDAFLHARLAHAFGMTADQLHDAVRVALERTERATWGACGGQTSSQSRPWWDVALGVAGVVGLAALVGFGVAAVLSERAAERAPST